MSKIAILEDRKSYSNDLVRIIGIELPDAVVDVFNDVDTALEALDSLKTWDILVVDLMMPVGSRFSSIEADYGLATGSRFIDIALEKNAATSAIFVITSRNTDSDDFAERSDIIQEFQKSQVTQVELARRIRDHMAAVSK